MADTARPSIDKRVVYLGLMLLTLAYPLVVLTIIVSTQNDYDDEGNRIKPLPQVSCPVEGAEGDIDCVSTPLAYAHIDSILWAYLANELVMHSSYVLYTKLWATAGIVFGFWRELLSVLAFLVPELALNSAVYLLQTFPFVRKMMPWLKTRHFPLIVSFLIGAVLSTLYGLGTSQTTDQFRRTVTLAGPGTMFLFVDWFSRSVFLPFFELMQNTFTQLKVNTLLLAVFELVLTNLYGSLFLPATQKLCVVLARFFYNVSYGVDSKVSLYDYVNLRPSQDGLDPSNPLSKRTTLVSPKDIGTYEPEECRSSFSSLTRRRHHAPRSLVGDSVPNVQPTAARSGHASAQNGASPQRTPGASEPHTNTTVVEINHGGVSGTKQALHQPTPQKGNNKTGERRRRETADRPREEAAGHDKERDEGRHIIAHIKGLPGNSTQRETATVERDESDGARVRERRPSRERDAHLDNRPLPASGFLHAADEKRRASERRQQETELGAASRSLEAVDVEVGRSSHTLRTSVHHFLEAPQWTGREANDLHVDYPGRIDEPSPSPPGNVEDDALQQDTHDPLNNNQRDRLEKRNSSASADAENDAELAQNSSDLHRVMPDAVVSERPALKESAYSGMSGGVYSHGLERSQVVETVHGEDVCSAEQSHGYPGTGEPADNALADGYTLNRNKRSSRASRTSCSSPQDVLGEQNGVCEVVAIAETLPPGSQALHRVSNMADEDTPQVLVEKGEGQGGVHSLSDKGHRRHSSLARDLTSEGHEEALHERPAAGGDYVEEHARRVHKKRHSAVERDFGQGDDDVQKPSRSAHRKRHSAVGADFGEGNDFVEEPFRRAQAKRQSAIGANYGEGNDHIEGPARRARKKRQSAVGADFGEGNEHVGETVRRPHRKRQSALQADYAEGDDYADEPVRRPHRKRQSAVGEDYGEGGDYVEQPTRRPHRKRQSAVGADYGEGEEHVEEPVRRARRKKQSVVDAYCSEDDDSAVEAAQRDHGKRQSALETGYEETRERDGGRTAVEKSPVDAGRSATSDGKTAAKSKISRKNKKHAYDETNAALSERTEPAGIDVSPSPVPFISQNDGRTDAFGGPGSQNPRLSKCFASSGSGGAGTIRGSFGHGHPNAVDDEQRPFRSNIYIPYREGFGSDAVEFEKIITWFNMIWDSWRFLLLRTVMVKASNVFIFFIMIFKDFIYSMWHFCVRYDERFVLTSLELNSVKSRKNKRLVKMLDWFQALVVRPFFMPRCLATTTWRSQLLFGLNAQKAQSRMRGVAVIRHSKRKDFGLRTLSNMSDNAPRDAPNNPTPQKAARGLGMMLKSFFKDLGHDIAAHFKVEMERAMTGFWGRAQTKTRRRLSKKSGSSLQEGTQLECDINYAYGSELVVVRNVPVTVRSRNSRSSTSFGSASRSTSETGRHSIRMPGFQKHEKITFRDLFRRRDDSAFRKVHASWASQVVEELQSLVFGRTWPRLLQKLMSSLSLVVSDVFAEHTKIGLLPAYRTFGLFRTFDGRVRLFLIFSFDLLEVLTVWKVQSLSRFYKSIKEGFNNLHDGPLLLLCTVNCAGTLMYFGMLRYVRFAHIYGDKRALPDVNHMEMLTQLNLTK